MSFVKAKGTGRLVGPPIRRSHWSPSGLGQSRGGPISLTTGMREQEVMCFSLFSYIGLLAYGLMSVEASFAGH